MLSKLIDSLLDYIISFLAVDDYIVTLKISQQIRRISLKYKKIRRPFIYATKYYHYNERYNKLCSNYYLTHECKERLKAINPNIFEQKKELYYNRDLIKDIMKHGQKCDRSENKSFDLSAVPWIFRKCLKVKQTKKLDVNKYVRILFDKYEAKVRDITDDVDKEKMRSVLFEKLIRKRDFLIQYLKTWDVYMTALDNELDKLMNKAE